VAEADAVGALHEFFEKDLRRVDRDDLSPVMLGEKEGAGAAPAPQVGDPPFAREGREASQKVARERRISRTLALQTAEQVDEGSEGIGVVRHLFFMYADAIVFFWISFVPS
jgi:hypothetical protein